MIEVRKCDLYELPNGMRIRAACDGLAVDGRLIPSERMAAALNTLGGYGKVKRRSEARDEPTHPSGT